MLRVALLLLIALSAVPFAAAAPRPAPVRSDVRSSAVRPTVRLEATATSPARVAGVTATASPTRGAGATATASPPPPVQPDALAGRTDSPPQDPPVTEVPRIATVAAGTPTGAARVAVTVPPPTATASPTVTPPPPLAWIDRIIATRGDHQLPHEINLPPPLDGYSFGQHGTEDNKTLPDGARSVNLWLGVGRDVSQLDAELSVRVNIRNIRGYVYQPSTQTWEQIFSGLPTWMVSVDNLPPFNYYDIAPTHEADGSYSFEVPPGRGLHMSSPAPGLAISESDGVLCIVEARLLGPDAFTARLGMAAGADYRDAAGDGASIRQAGFGQIGLLTGSWKAFAMLSSTLTDDEVRADPPPVAR